MVNCHPTVAETLTQNEQETVEELEHRLGKILVVRSQSVFHVEQFEIVSPRS
jgi:Ribonuclease G/E